MPPTRDEAISTLRAGDGDIRRLVDRLSQAELVAPATIGDGDWSAKDLVAHLQTWEAFALDALRQWRKGERPAIEETFADPRRVDQLNAATIEQKRDLTPEQVRAEAGDTHRTLIETIEQMSDEEWMAKASYPTDRRRRLCELLGSVLGAPQRPFGHAFAHLPSLEAYVRSLG
jgi:hypothetical protein